jgi:hypothetical protein
MTPNALGLSSAQINLVMDAAERVAPAWRHRFLEAVSDNLMYINALSVVTNSDVEDVIVDTCKRMRLPTNSCDRGGR